MNQIITGGNTAVTRLLVEAIYLGVSVAIPWALSYVVNNPSLFGPQWVVICRLALGLVGNLLNPNVPNA